jgi:beta-glucanase (GH16 family)
LQLLLSEQRASLRSQTAACSFAKDFFNTINYYQADAILAEDAAKEKMTRASSVLGSEVHMSTSRIVGFTTDCQNGIRMRVWCALFLAAAYLLLATSAVAQTWGTPDWSEEFNSTTAGPPDITMWNFDLGNSGGWGNAEMEIYCGPPGYPNNPAQCPTTFSTSTSNAYIDGSGHLVIQAINNGGTWTSARLNTLTNPPTTFQYGRIEASEKLPLGAGLWPAFWALGSNISSVGWPGCGEIDFMENVPSAGGLGPATFSSTIHGPGYSGGNGLGGRYTFPRGDVTAFHIYGAIWSPFMIEFYVDDPANVFFIRTASDIPSGTQWVFNHPFVLLTNLAVGGNWPGPPDNTTPSPSVMLVDFVRHYKAAAVPPPNLGNPPAITVKAGATTGNTSALSILSQSGSGRVYLNCSTPAPRSSCSVNTGYALNSGVADFTSANSADAIVTVTTTANSILPPHFFRPKPWLGVLVAALALLLWALAALALRLRARVRWWAPATIAALILTGAMVAGCGGTSSAPAPRNDGTPAGSYSITVNAYTASNTTGNPDAAVSIALTVN